jgi:hypothetical protein
VLVIQRGEIVEQSSHQQRISPNGFYDSLYMSQFKGQAILRFSYIIPFSAYNWE